MKAPAMRFEDLVVWQKAANLCCTLLEVDSQAILNSDF